MKGKQHWIVGLALVGTVMAGYAVPTPPLPPAQKGSGQGPLAALKLGGALLGTQPLAALQHPEVRKELGLSASQRSQIDDVVAQMKADLQEKVRRAKRNPFGANRSALKREAEARLAQADRDAQQVLDASQRKRLREVCVNVGGSLSVVVPEIGREVGVSEGQRSRIQEEVDNLRKGLAGLSADGGSSDPEAKRLSASAQARADAILSPSQRDKLRDLAGSPFRLP
jgi:hypothetical protein